MKTLRGVDTVLKLKLFLQGSTGVYNNVDIYDVSTGRWTTATLSTGRTSVAAATVGDRFAVFVGN